MAIYAVHVYQSCNSLLMANIYGRNMYELWEPRSSGLLRSKSWWFITDDSGQAIGAIFRVKIPFLTPEDSTDRLSQNGGKKLPLFHA